MSITYKQVRKLFKYNGKDLIWNKTIKGKTVKGNIAGCLRSDRYRFIGINNKSYLAHRLIWFYHYGYFPENEIDHINKNKIDNRIENLREASHSCNIRNRGNYNNNISGVKGVHFNKASKKWIAYIWADGKPHGLGYFKNFNEAVLTRYAAEQCLEWEGCDSNSPAYQYALKNNLIRSK